MSHLPFQLISWSLTSPETKLHNNEMMAIIYCPTFDFICHIHPSPPPRKRKNDNHFGWCLCFRSGIILQLCWIWASDGIRSKVFNTPVKNCIITTTFFFIRKNTVASYPNRLEFQLLLRWFCLSALLFSRIWLFLLTRIVHCYLVFICSSWSRNRLGRGLTWMVIRYAIQRFYYWLLFMQLNWGVQVEDQFKFTSHNKYLDWKRTVTFFVRASMGASDSTEQVSIQINACLLLFSRSHFNHPVYI